MSRIFYTSLVLIIANSTSYANYCDQIHENGFAFFDASTKPSVELYVGSQGQDKIYYQKDHQFYTYPINFSCTNDYLTVSWEKGELSGMVKSGVSWVIFTDLNGNFEGGRIPFSYLTTQHNPSG